jgi:hypothetical protein
MEEEVPMSTKDLEVGPAWQEMDEQAMTGVDGGGPFAEFVYDVTHTVVSAARFAYDLLPRRTLAYASGGGGGGGW